MATDRAVGIVPVCRDNKQIRFCVVQETDGHWGFPKGHAEPGESDEATAMRELREETGVERVELVPNKMITEHYSFERNGERIDKEVVYFIGLVSEQKSQTQEAFKGEVTDVQWLTYNEAKQTLTFPEARQVLDDIWEYLKNHLE